MKSGQENSRKSSGEYEVQTVNSVIFVTLTGLLTFEATYTENYGFRIICCIVLCFVGLVVSRVRSVRVEKS